MGLSVVWEPALSRIIGNELAEKTKEATKYVNVDLSKTEVRDIIKQNKEKVAKAFGGREERKAVLLNTKESWGNESRKKQMKKE